MSELLPLSLLNQWAYCPRRFWYMHVQGEMVENVHVARGVLDHAHVHTPGDESAAPGILLHRRVYVYSHRLGIGGFCDLVEEHADGRWAPVEYKEGRRGRWRNDHAQLCAQALCLEEMSGRAVPTGYLFYFGDRRREMVSFDPSLRQYTCDLIDAIHRALAAGAIPPHTERPARCRGCSLVDICLPRETQLLCAATAAQPERSSPQRKRHNRKAG
ncbi:MAG TPA: CRISPR-associated protein Cas4 [Caldilineaceae bacterium]|nr:CRISPR-associated protein Cas4 [Caldilineaceae bacterium]